ncbi:MAG: hypothetical protein H6880_11135 [Rhodobiaceae bacterium]|nr:hypothetical protein [Rhodobiaceae bacterium]
MQAHCLAESPRQRKTEARYLQHRGAAAAGDFAATCSIAPADISTSFDRALAVVSTPRAPPRQSHAAR